MNVGSPINIKNGGDLRFFETDNTNYVGFKSPGTVAADNLYELPAAFPAVNGYGLRCTTAGVLSWAAEGTGTVTSVAMTVPGFLSVSGSPITTSGTLAVTLATQSANTVFSGPTSGPAATPTFRSLVTADIPAANLSAGTGISISAGSGTGALLVAATLAIDQAFTPVWTALHTHRLSAATSAAIFVEVSGDAETRFQLDASGKIQWATGAVATDVSLERSAAGILLETANQNASSEFKVSNSNTGASALALFRATSGSVVSILSSFSNGAYGYAGTTSNHPFYIITNNAVVAQFSVAGALDVDVGFTIGAAAASGKYLRGDGSNFVSASLAAADMTGILTSTVGGTGNGFTKFSGPASSEKTFTLPNVSTYLATADINDVSTVSTGAATETKTLFSYTIPSDTLVMVVTYVVGYYAGGDTGAAYERIACFRNDAGTVTQIGVTDALTTFEDVGATTWDCDIDFSGTAARVRVTSNSPNVVNWKGHTRIYSVA